MVKASFDELKAQIEHSTTVQTSAVELIKGLADRIADLATHPTAEEINELAADVRRHASALAGAIALHEDKGEEEGEEEDEEKDEP